MVKSPGEIGSANKELTQCLFISQVAYADICQTLTNFAIEDTVWNLVSDEQIVLMTHHSDDKT